MRSGSWQHLNLLFGCAQITPVPLLGLFGLLNVNSKKMLDSSWLLACVMHSGALYIPSVPFGGKGSEFFLQGTETLASRHVGREQARV